MQHCTDFVFIVLQACYQSSKQEKGFAIKPAMLANLWYVTLGISIPIVLPIMLM